MWSKTGHSVFVENSTQTQNDSKPVAEFETKCAAACILLTLINRKQHSAQGTFVSSQLRRSIHSRFRQRT